MQPTLHGSIGVTIVNFSACYVDMGGAPTNQEMCYYIDSGNRSVLPRQVFVAIGMRTRVIHNVCIEHVSGNHEEYGQGV